MKSKLLNTIFSTLVLGFLLLLSFHPAAAQAPVDVTLTGKIVSIDSAAGSFMIEDSEGVSATIFAPDGYDLTQLALDSWVQVEGTQNPDGSVAASLITQLEVVQLSGEVTGLSPLEGTLTLKADGQTYMIYPPDGFDWTSIATGDDLSLTGILNEDGSVQALSITVSQGDDEDETVNNGFYCTQSESQHPVGSILAEIYEQDYATLQDWFCSGHGWGQIMLALQTGEVKDVDPSSLLAARSEGSGWGQIWRDLGENGRPKGGDDAPRPGLGNASGDKSNRPGRGAGTTGNPGHGNPNDLDGDGRPDKSNSHNPKK